MTGKKTFDQLMREGTPEEISAATPPTGRYIPKKVRDAVFEKFGYACFYCGKRGDLTPDHFVPRTLGGTTVSEAMAAPLLPF